jgi:chitin biosynthesis protein CHS5
MDMHSTKISGLQISTEYSFYLVLRTSGGTYTSNTLTVKTHDMNNLTGITVTPGVLPAQLRESLEAAVERIGAKIVDTPRIDTTHFICTEGRGKEWERANEMNIPVVRPEWIEGCEREGKIIGVRGYYLDANPKHRQIGSNPSLSGAPAMASPASQQAMAASQSQLPIRNDPGPKSPDRESAVSGEPGPEVNEPPTPPPKEERGAPPATVEEDEDESDDDADDPEKPRVPDERATATSSKEIGEESSEDDERPEAQHKSKEAEDDKKDKGLEMEDVAL